MDSWVGQESWSQQDSENMQSNTEKKETKGVRMKDTYKLKVSDDWLLLNSVAAFDVVKFKLKNTVFIPKGN